MEEKTGELMKKGMETVDAAGELNLQAGLEFTLIGTNLYALFQSKEKKNTFLVMPTSGESDQGMSIDLMVEEINKLIKGATGRDAGLDGESIKGSITDVVNASQETPQTNVLTVKDISWPDIQVHLEQAFLYLNTGEPAEYAFAIRINSEGLFGDSSFFNVTGLSLGIWNTNRKKVLERMSLKDVDGALQELQ